VIPSPQHSPARSTPQPAALPCPQHSPARSTHCTLQCTQCNVHQDHCRRIRYLTVFKIPIELLWVISSRQRCRWNRQVVGPDYVLCGRLLNLVEMIHRDRNRFSWLNQTPLPELHWSTYIRSPSSMCGAQPAVEMPGKCAAIGRFLRAANEGNSSCTTLPCSGNLELPIGGEAC
jgi:hypothetical protein